MIAAAGNQGPFAPPGYPAAYPQTLAITAVGPALNPYRLANRGPHIDFSAPGVEIWSAEIGHGFARPWTGTSFAAVFATAAVARLTSGPRRIDPAQAYDHLRARSRDLGPPGKDTVFGWGLIRTAPHCPPPKE